MKTTIKHRVSGAPLFTSGDDETLKDAVVSCVRAGVDLRCADLRGADLRGLDLRGVDLGGVDLTGADISGAQLSGAYLGGAWLYDLRHDNTRLDGVNFEGARGVTDVMRAAAQPPPEGETAATRAVADAGVGGANVGR